MGSTQFFTIGLDFDQLLFEQPAGTDSDFAGAIILRTKDSVRYGSSRRLHNGNCPPSTIARNDNARDIHFSFRVGTAPTWKFCSDERPLKHVDFPRSSSAFIFAYFAQIAFVPRPSLRRPVLRVGVRQRGAMGKSDTKEGTDNIQEYIQVKGLLEYLFAA